MYWITYAKPPLSDSRLLPRNFGDQTCQDIAEHALWLVQGSIQERGYRLSKSMYLVLSSAVDSIPLGQQAAGFGEYFEPLAFRSSESSVGDAEYPSNIFLILLTNPES